MKKIALHSTLCTLLLVGATASANISFTLGTAAYSSAFDVKVPVEKRYRYQQPNLLARPSGYYANLSGWR
ncbi:MAG: hypothetical protein LR015_10840 [Verrucomicrobia bacterium]|nr:hypothetical protein [Verrucomicrobiota bacterium]